MDFFLSSLSLASIILLAFFGILWIVERIIEWQHFRKNRKDKSEDKIPDSLLFVFEQKSLDPKAEKVLRENLSELTMKSRKPRKLAKLSDQAQ